MACGLLLLDLGDVQAELEPGPPPGHPHDAVAEDLLGERLAVGRGGQRDAGVGMQVIDVGGVDQAVHGGVDGRSGPAASVQAVVERRDHLVFALDAGIHVDKRLHPIQPQHGKPVLGQGAEVSAGSLDPQQLYRLTGDRIGFAALGGGVAAGVVGVLRIGPEPVGSCDQVGDGVVCHCFAF